MNPTKPLRIAIISRTDSTGGGGGRVAEELAKGLNQTSLSATHFVESREPGNTPLRRSLFGGTATARLANRAKAKLTHLGLPHLLPLDAPGLLAGGILTRFDIVHFHDLGPAMSPLTIAALSRRMPTLWTFHDCSPFTGGCVYPMDCARFKTRCGTDGGCPQLGQWPMGDLYDFTGTLQAMRGLVHRHGKITTIAPSEWLADIAMSSGKVPARPQVISNGIDIGTFKPAPDRAALRRELGLPNDQPILLLTSASLLYERKGLRHALAAIRAVQDLNPFVLVIGGADATLASHLEGIAHHATGFISNAAELARWSSAADLQINCALAEVQGLVILEAMACGVPAVAFASGGIPASIEHETSGFLVPPLDMPALIAGLRHALEPGIAEAWGLAARRRVEQNFSFQQFLDRHRKLYARLSRSGGDAR